MDKPAIYTGTTVGVLTGCLQGILQYITTDTAQQTLIYRVHKSLNVKTHHDFRRQAGRVI